MDKHMTEEEIDEAVVALANDPDAWEVVADVQRAPGLPITLPPRLAARAAYFASAHHAASIEAWLLQVIQERIDLEERALVTVKRELAAHSA